MSERRFKVRTRGEMMEGSFRALVDMGIYPLADTDGERIYVGGRQTHTLDIVATDRQAAREQAKAALRKAGAGDLKVDEPVEAVGE